MQDLCFLSAVEQSQLLRRREISASELLEACLERIEAFNPAVNALVILAVEEARAAARESDLRLARAEPLGPLEGLPLAVKDIFQTRQLRTTFGSLAYSDHLPEEDALIVARERAAGAVILGKSNTPEFAFGAQTKNPVFGLTRNPYDQTKSVSGSSGGAAAALAAGFVALADGSDLGGSLRSPAAWCNVAGFRPSPGVVPYWPTALPHDRLHTPGPMARSVADIPLFLSAIAGPDPRSPLRPVELDLSGNLEGPVEGLRIAWCLTPLGSSIDPEVQSILNRQREVLDQLGCTTVDADPDLAGASRAQEIFKLWNAAQEHGATVERAGSVLGPVILEHVARGRDLSITELSAADDLRRNLAGKLDAFMAEFDLLVWPVTSVPPHSAETPEDEIDMDWRVLDPAPLLGLPALSLPAGFTKGGLPIGLQIVGAPLADRQVLTLGLALEKINPFWRLAPKIK